MTETTNTYLIDPELEAALVAAAATGKAVWVKGNRTHLIRLEPASIWQDYDPGAVLRVVEQSAENPYSVEPGELDDVLADMQAAREQDSAGRPARP